MEDYWIIFGHGAYLSYGLGRAAPGATLGGRAPMGKEGLTDDCWGPGCPTSEPWNSFPARVALVGNTDPRRWIRMDWWTSAEVVPGHTLVWALLVTIEPTPMYGVGYMQYL